MNNERISMNRTERQQVARIAQSFELFDNKGREFGYSFIIDCEVWVKDENGGWGVEASKADLYEGMSWLVEPHALRDGKWFGAIPTNAAKRFKSFDEALAHCDKAMAKARKTAEKKAVA